MVFDLCETDEKGNTVAKISTVRCVNKEQTEKKTMNIPTLVLNNTSTWNRTEWKEYKQCKVRSTVNKCHTKWTHCKWHCVYLCICVFVRFMYVFECACVHVCTWIFLSAISVCMSRFRCVFIQRFMFLHLLCILTIIIISIVVAQCLLIFGKGE